MKTIQSKRARACSISKRVKDKVWERDGHQCIWCHSFHAAPEAHYISRARGGLGCEENILTLCRRCHGLYDQGTREMRERMKVVFRAYLRSKYPAWDENELIYRRNEKC